MATLREILYQAGFRGAALDTAYAIAMAESGGRATAHNPDASTGDNSYGLFQINMLGAMGPERRERYNLSSNEDLFDPLTNAKIAYQMSNGGKNWSPWTTYTTGIYRDYLDGGDTEVTGRSGPGAGNAGARKKGSTYGTYGYVQEFLDKHPEIGELIDKAEKQDWTPEKLQGAIKETKWWQNHSEAQRQWSLLIAESPEGEVVEQIKDARNALERVFTAAGVKVGDKELDDLAEKAARNQWDESEMRLAASRRFELGGRKAAVVGEAGMSATVIDQMAWEYGVPVDRATKEKWIKKSIAGQLDVETMQDVLREQAKLLYPTAAAQLNTQTLRDVMSPYMQIAAEQLGIAPDQMKAQDPKWTAALDNGKGGMMSADQWTRTIRVDKRYGWDKTSTAKREAASMVTELSRMMGVGF